MKSVLVIISKMNQNNAENVNIRKRSVCFTEKVTGKSFQKMNKVTR